MGQLRGYLPHDARGEMQLKYQNDIKPPKTATVEQSETEKSAGYASALSTRSAPEDRRLLYGVLLSLPEFREAYHSQTGYCRGCRAVYPDTALMAKGQQCAACGRPRVFGAVQYVWNGWIKELPAGNQKWRNIQRLLEERTERNATVPASSPVAQSVET
jgi:hypothetical protein